MINIMLSQVEHEIGLFFLRVWVLYAAVSWEASSVLLLVYVLIRVWLKTKKIIFSSALLSGDLSDQTQRN